MPENCPRCDGTGREWRWLNDIVKRFRKCLLCRGALIVELGGGDA
jgi:hypothetical protein